MSKRLILSLSLVLILGLTTGCNDKTKNKEELTPSINVEEVLSEESISEDLKEESVSEYGDLNLQSSTEEILDYIYSEDENMYAAAQDMIGKQVIDFDFENKKGTVQSISSFNEREGSFILELMASWCSTCKELEPTLEEYREKGSAPIVSVSYNETRNELNSDSALIDTSYVNVLTSDISLVEEFNLQYIPSMYFIDEAGVVQFVMIGNTDIETLHFLTARFLNK